MKYQFRPLSSWDGPRTPDHERRSRGTFKASWSNTIKLLARELFYLDADHIVIEADVREQDIRLDGMLRSNAKVPEFPGVRLAFDSKFGPLIYATDSCAIYQHNVRSIALGLEALRAVDRYGVTRRGEQYRGWAAIEAATPDMPTTVAEAEALIDRFGGTIRRAMRHTHPDHGGDPDDFRRVMAAKRLIEEAS